MSKIVFESNIYETVVDLMRRLVMENDGKRYIFILDSVDGLISKSDYEVDFGDSTRVAGGAVIAAHLMKKIAIALAKRGHMAIFISQVRADIRIEYSAEPMKQIPATGGNAYLHFANVILEFRQRTKADWILRDQKKKMSKDNPIIGHWATVVIKKSANEKKDTVVKYPIKYGRTGGNSIWLEKELVDMLLAWDFVEKKGSWYSASEEFNSELEEAGIPRLEKVQGEEKLFNALENDRDLCNFVLEKFKKLLQEH